MVFGAQDTSEASFNLRTAGIALQVLLLGIMVRELAIMLWECCRGRVQNYKQRLIRYAVVCCFDNCTLLGFAIWTAVALAMDESNCQENPECYSFYRGTFINMIMAFIGFCAQCCCPAPCIMIHYGNKMREWTN